MAASTWFQASTCPAGYPSKAAYQGMAPEGSCWPAMVSAVARTCARVRICRSAHIGRLCQVDDHALPDQRVEHLLGQPGRERPLHDVPDQDLVIGLGEGVLTVVDADGALDPPVGR